MIFMMYIYDNSELYHYGVKGMKWGVRKNTVYSSGKHSKSKTRPVLYKKGEAVELHQKPTSPTAKFLAAIMPSLKTKQDAYSDYTIKSKSGEVVGSISTNRDSAESLNVVWLGVKNKSSGKGYGSSAMRTVIHHAKEQGYKNITLEVPTTSPNARHIYEKLGFKDTGEAMLGDENDVWGGLTKMRLDL